MPLRVGLTYTQMKLGRAYEHLDQLKREVDVSSFRVSPAQSQITMTLNMRGTSCG
jgi:hypothetical protein